MTFRRFIFTAVGWLAAAVLFYGTINGLNRLTSLACGVGFVSLIGGGFATRRLAGNAIERMARRLGRVMIGSLVLFFCLSMSLGGGALNGRIEDGSYFLRNHGVETRVSRRTFYFVAGFEICLFALWPAGMTFRIKAENFGDAAAQQKE